MSLSASNYSEIKMALKEALIELIDERRDLVQDLLREVFEENNVANSPLSSVPNIPTATSDRDTDADGLEAIVDSEISTFRKLHPTLLQKHKGEFVAIHQNELVDHDTDKSALYQRIQARYPNRFVLLRYVEDAPDRELYMRSTRYAIKSS